MRQLLLATLSVTMLFSAPAAFAIDQDAAFAKNKSFVGDTHGECVRTKWMHEGDPCAPYVPPPEPAPVPVAAPEPEPMPIVSLFQRTIYFEFDSAQLTDEAKTKLDALVTIINESKAIADVSIHGFTDQFGSSSYNDALANSRAAAVESYLDERSRLDSSVAEVKGLGKSSPQEGCGALKKRDEKIACMAEERRVEIEFKSEK